MSDLKGPGPEKANEELLQSIARSLSLLVKLKVAEVQATRKLKLNEMVLCLHSLGCRPVEIADALGRTQNDVNPVLSRARSGGSKAKKSRRRKSGR